MKNLFLTGLFSITMVFSACISASAQELVEKAPEVVRQTKEVEGVVAGAGPGAIAVTAGVNDAGASMEMSFNVPANVRFVHRKSMKDINVGDTVKIVYEETVSSYPDKRRKSVREVKQVIFLKPGAARKAEADAPEHLRSTETISSEVQQPAQPTDNILPLKGAKGEQ
jgi:hypothetical protein